MNPIYELKSPEGTKEWNEVMKKNDSIHKTYRSEMLWFVEKPRHSPHCEHVFWIFFIFYSPRSQNHASTMSKKHHKLYPIYYSERYEKKRNEYFFTLIRFRCIFFFSHALLASVGDLHSLSRWRANIICDYLHIYAAFCLLLIIV